MDKQYDPAIENTEDQVEETAVAENTEPAESPEPAENTEPEQKPAGHRRQSRSAFFVGFLMSMLSVLGVVSLVMGGISWIRSATDTSALKEEMYYYLEPVLVYTPAAFENVNETEQDNLLIAAAYRVMQKEQIRMLREKDDTSIYAVDDNGRIAVETAVVTESYQTLFGPEAVLQHRSVEDSNLEYSEADDCYYIPFETANTASRPVVFSIKNGWKTYEVRIGYVPITDVQMDEYGNEMDPTEAMATHFQTYTLQKTDEGYYILSCVDE